MKLSTTHSLRATLLSLLLFGACLAGPQSYQPQSGDFSVWMPGTPKVSVQSQETPVGPVDSTTYEATEGQNMYSVTVTKLPSVALLFKGKDGILDETRQGLMKEMGGQETGWDKANGRLSYTTGDKIGEARILISNSQLYVVNGVAPQPAQDKVLSFLSSFQSN